MFIEFGDRLINLAHVKRFEFPNEDVMYDVDEGEASPNGIIVAVYTDGERQEMSLRSKGYMHMRKELARLEWTQATEEIEDVLTRAVSNGTANINP